MKRYTFFLFLCFLTSLVQGQESNYNKLVKAEIFLKNQDNFVEIVGIASNLSQVDQQIRYELAVLKKDTSNNTAKTNQTGNITVLKGYKAAVAKTSVSLKVPDQITIMLLVYDINNKLIGKELKTIKPFTNRVEEPREMAEDGFAIKGIIVEKTRTKPAKDFYKEFYRLYHFYKIDGDQVVTITEKIGQGRSSKIEVTVGYKLVFEFYVNPNPKAIKQISRQALGQVNTYFNNAKAQKQY